MASQAEKIFGKYHLVDKIATGGMAEVYKAKSFGVAGFEKTLVIKRILPNLASDKKFVEMFLDEARIASNLSHINIVQIFDLGKEDDDYFIAMEWVDGTDLKTLVERARERRRAVPVNLVAYIISEVAKGLDYAHRRKDQQRRDMNIVHRDISPHNILVSHAGEVKITDFGIARASSKVTITRSGVIRGKFAYMSPEQARGDSIDRRSDVFSLGIVLYEVVTGTRLFKSKNDLETLKRVQTGPITPPSRLNPDVTPELESIILKALDRDRERRFQYSSELYDDLTSYLFGAGEKVGSAELASWVGKVLGAHEEENDRTTDFDAFVNAIEEIGGAKPPQTMLTPLPAVDSSVRSRSRSRASAADEPTRLEGRSGSGRAQQDEKDTTKVPRLVEAPPSRTRSTRTPMPSDGGTKNTQAVARSNEASAALLSGEGRLVGRSDELKRIREVLARVARGEGQTMVFTGEDGIGKSRLLAELQMVSRELDVAFYVARARRETSAVPYATLREVLREIVGLKATDSEEVVLERIQRLAQLGLTPAEVHFVGAIFGLFISGSSVQEFRGSERRRAMHAAVEKIIQGLARERPMIIAVDDLDLADELTCSALDHIASGIQTMPVMVLATAASDLTRLPLAAAQPGRFHRILLKALSEFSTAMLARGVLQVEELGSSIAALVQQRSGGNPLRIREVIRFLLASGSLKVTKGRALLDGTPESLFVPATAAMLAADAVAKVPEADRKILAIAGAAGERFETAAVQGVFPGTDLEAALRRLEELGLLRADDPERETDVRAWRFSHRTFREAAAAAVPKDESPSLHRSLAESIARLPDSQRADHAGLLWSHLAAAGAAEKSLEALERLADGLLVEGGGRALAPAAEQACSLFADAPLGMDAKRAASLRARAHLTHGALLAAANDTERARTAVERARSAAEAGNDPALAVKVERAYGDDASRRGKPEVAAEHYDRARRLVEELLEKSSDSASKLAMQRDLVDLEVLVARELRLAGDASKALRRCKDALERAQELRESTRVGACLDELANIHEKLGEHARAMKLWDLAVGIWMKIGDKRSLMRTFEALGTEQLEEGDLEGAKNLFREALELARETGDVEGSARVLNALARAHLKLRQYAPAQALFLESQAIARRFQLHPLEKLSAIYLAALTAYTTDLQEGIRALETTLSQWEKETTDKFGLLQAELLLGNAYKMARRVGPTNQHYVRALGLARELGLDRYIREITREMKEAF